jgi:hypothetical protein
MRRSKQYLQSTIFDRAEASVRFRSSAGLAQKANATGHFFGHILKAVSCI